MNNGFFPLNVLAVAIESVAYGDVGGSSGYNAFVACLHFSLVVAC